MIVVVVVVIETQSKGLHLSRDNTSGLGVTPPKNGNAINAQK